jgi:helicase
MGINLPVRQVLLYDLQTFDGTSYHPLSTNSVWQRVGRAGRPGLDDRGEAVLMVPAWDSGAEKYQSGLFESIRSELSAPQALAEQIVAEVASGLSRTEAQLQATFRQSLAALQGSLPNVPAVITEMCVAGFLTEDQSDEDASRPTLRATRLGHIATRHLLSPATVLLFHRALAKHKRLSPFDLLLVTSCSVDCEPLLPVDFEELDYIATSLTRERSFLLQLPQEEIVNFLKVDGKRLLTALKMSLVISAWTQTGSYETVAQLHGCYPFEVSRLQESMSRLLLSMSAILGKPDEEASERETLTTRQVGIVRAMVEGGLDELTATLTLVRGIGPRNAKRLKSAGIASLRGLARLSRLQQVSISGITEGRLIKWSSEARAVMRKCPPEPAYEDVPEVPLKAYAFPHEVDPYRLGRARALTVINQGDGRFLVSGGLDPHVVQRKADASGGLLFCDCADMAKGNKCKHVLAVLIKLGDPSLRGLVGKLSARFSKELLNVFELWFNSDNGKEDHGRAQWQADFAR